jgi:hypothetical protein
MPHIYPRQVTASGPDTASCFRVGDSTSLISCSVRGTEPKQLQHQSLLLSPDSLSHSCSLTSCSLNLLKVSDVLEISVAAMLRFTAVVTSGNGLKTGSSSLSVSRDGVPCPPACDDGSGAADEVNFSLLSSFAANSGCGHLRLDAFCLAVLNMDER